jgi:1-acyl-sn-glycerol-3-phosphate acyltransferase
MIRSFFHHAWLPLAYYLSWLLFGLGGLSLNLACAPALLFPRREDHGPLARALNTRILDLWTRWLHASRVVQISYHGFEPARLPRAVVYVANHPSLVDAPFLLARLTDTVCIFKPALLRNPFIGPAALICGYVSGDAGVDGIRAAAARVSSGCSLLIFPEGTRTAPGSELNPLRRGFALIARRAGAPIQLIHVRASPLMARKGHPWWKLPPLPGRFEFTLGELIPADSPLSTSQLADYVDARLRVAAPPMSLDAGAVTKSPPAATALAPGSFPAPRNP